MFAFGYHDEGENKELAFGDEEGADFGDLGEVVGDRDELWERKFVEFVKNEFVLIGLGELEGGERFEFGADTFQQFDEELKFFVGFDGFLENLQILHK